jgi:hypothetical protein
MLEDARPGDNQRIAENSPAIPARLESICPVCGGRLIEIKQKWLCENCHSIVATCCDGGRQE